MAEAIFFYIFAALTVIGALVVVIHKNPVSSAISLVLTFFCTAALFVLLHAHFVAAIQVLVYAGAIIVLFLFTVMFLNIKDESLRFDSQQVAKRLTFLVIIVCVVGYFANKVANYAAKTEFVQSSEFGSVEGVGKVLFLDYLLPFELTSILILAAIIGVVAIAQKSAE